MSWPEGLGCQYPTAYCEYSGNAHSDLMKKFTGTRSSSVPCRSCVKEIAPESQASQVTFLASRASNNTQCSHFQDRHRFLTENRRTSFRSALTTRAWMAKAKFAIVVIRFTLGGTNAGEPLNRPDQKPLLPLAILELPRV